MRDEVIWTRYDKQTNVFVGWCPKYNLYSQGLTRKEAESATNKAVKMYIEESEKMGIKVQDY